MAAGHGIQETLRDVTLRDVTLLDMARRDGPGRAVAAADVAAWERAEGWGSEAAAAAVARRGIERWIPGLPARRTYKVLGWMAVAAILVDGALAWAPPSAGIDTADTWVRYGTAIVFVAAAAWSLLSEVRGWEGSDAATWFLKARVKRHETRLAARRRALRDTVIAVGAGRARRLPRRGRARHARDARARGDPRPRPRGRRRPHGAAPHHGRRHPPLRLAAARPRLRGGGGPARRRGRLGLGRAGRGAGRGSPRVRPERLTWIRSCGRTPDDWA